MKDLELVEDVSPHAYTPRLATAAARFFARHLLERDSRIDSAEIRAIEPAILWCTPSGQIKADRDNARFVFEENQDRLAEFERARKAGAWWLRKTCTEGRAVLVLNVTGVGASEPNPLNAAPPHENYGVLHKFNDDLMWLNDSICALRTFDVLRAHEVLREWPNVDLRDLRAYAYGTGGLYAELAAALEPALGAIELHEALESFATRVRARHYDVYDNRTILLPGVLKHFDLPDLRRWRGATKQPVV